MGRIRVRPPVFLRVVDYTRANTAIPSPLDHTVVVLEGECSLSCASRLSHMGVSVTTWGSLEFLNAAAKSICDSCSDYGSYASEMRRSAFSRPVEELARAVSMGFVVPPAVLVDRERIRGYVRGVVLAAAEVYDLMQQGVPAEEALYAAPSSLRTRVAFAAPIRRLVEIATLETEEDAPWEIRVLARLLRRVLSPILPESLGEERERETAAQEA